MNKYTTREIDQEYEEEVDMGGYLVVKGWGMALTRVIVYRIMNVAYVRIIMSPTISMEFSFATTTATISTKTTRMNERIGWGLQLV